MKTQKNKNKIRNICIVVPTYNEANNISPLLDMIFFYERTQEIEDAADFFVLVVDDNSPDGTAEIVKDHELYGTRVHLLSRSEKNGLGAAYIAGMTHALLRFKPDAIVEMDADHSHDPQDVLRMIKELNAGADFVIGSRYVEGGEIPKGWGFHRKLFSFFASAITRKGLGLGNIRDCSGGFRAIRSEVFDVVNLYKLDVRGYAFQAALLRAALHSGFSVREIPITFHERSDGESKMRFSDMMEGWGLVFRFRANKILGRGI